MPENRKLEYATNYITPEVIDLSSEMLKNRKIGVKYPGGRWDLETLRELNSRGINLVLHGIIPSTGSIFDPHLCDNMDEFVDIVKQTNQKWLSLHFSSKPKFGNKNSIEVAGRNISIIREKLLEFVKEQEAIIKIISI